MYHFERILPKNQTDGWKRLQFVLTSAGDPLTDNTPRYRRYLADLFAGEDYKAVDFPCSIEVTSTDESGPLVDQFIALRQEDSGISTFSGKIEKESA